MVASHGARIRTQECTEAASGRAICADNAGYCGCRTSWGVSTVPAARLEGEEPVGVSIGLYSYIWACKDDGRATCGDARRWRRWGPDLPACVCLAR